MENQKYLFKNNIYTKNNNIKKDISFFELKYLKDKLERNNYGK